MEEKFFTKTSDFFKWITEIASKSGIKITTLGNKEDTYWVKWENQSENKKDGEVALPSELELCKQEASRYRTIASELSIEIEKLKRGNDR